MSLYQIDPHSSEGKVVYFKRIKEDTERNLQDWMNHLRMPKETLTSIITSFIDALDHSKQSDYLKKLNRSGINPFTYSCQNGLEDIVRLFITHGADVNARNGLFIPLTAACREKHTTIVNMLIAAGASVNKTDHFGETPLHAASSSGFIDIVKVLVDNQAKLDVTNKYGICPLYSSLLARQYKVTSYLIGKGSRLNLDEIDKKQLCTLINDMNIQYMIKGIGSKESLLLLAAEYGQKALLSQIIRCKPVDLNYVNEDGKVNIHRLGLHGACEIGDDDIVSKLIHEGANVKKPLSDGSTPLIIACKFKNKCVIHELLKHQANINHSNNEGKTALHIACEMGDDKIVSQLIHKRANVNQTCSDGSTPLIIACRNGSVGVVELILSCHNANIDHSNNEGKTALCIASETQNKKIVELIRIATKTDLV